MKVFTYELKIYEGSDHFWNESPSDKEVTAMVIEAIEADGGFQVVQGTHEDNTGNVDLTLKKMEVLS